MAVAVVILDGDVFVAGFERTAGVFHAGLRKYPCAENIGKLHTRYSLNYCLGNGKTVIAVNADFTGVRFEVFTSQQV